MGYQVYRIRGRHAGYGVPSYCEHPDCNEEIDRGMSFACGGEPGDNDGTCDRYFCSKHLSTYCYDAENEKECDHEEDCDCECRQMCDSCTGRDKQYPYGYPYKPEHPEWVYHLLNHYSWEEWRKENPEEVAKLKKLPARKPEYWTNDPDEDKI